MKAKTQNNKPDSGLITFSTETHHDVTLFKNVALELLQIMGHNSNVPGAIIADDVSTALNNLTSSVAAKPAPEPSIVTDDDDEEAQPEISLHNRAVPLIKLLSSASSEGKNVMWDWS